MPPPQMLCLQRGYDMVAVFCMFRADNIVDIFNSLGVCSRYMTNLRPNSLSAMNFTIAYNQYEDYSGGDADTHPFNML